MSRVYKPTRAGWVVLGIIAILAAGIVVGVMIGGGTGTTVVAVAAAILVLSIFVLFGQPNSKMDWKATPRDEEESRDYRG